MKSSRTPHFRLLPFILSALFLITAEISLAGNSFVKKIPQTRTNNGYCWSYCNNLG